MKKWLISLVLVVAGVSDAQEALVSPSVQAPSLESQLPIYQEDGEPGAVSAAPRSAFGLLIELILLLAVLSAGVYAVVYLLKRAQAAGQSANDKAIDSFRILAEQSLGRDQTLKVVELYSQIMVLVQSPQGVQFLCEMTDPEAKNRALLDFSRRQGQASRAAGATFLSQWRDKFHQSVSKPQDLKPTGDSENDSSPKTEFLKDSQERLKNL